MVKVAFIIFVFVLVNYVQGEFNLTIVHISDFHSHWFEFDENKHDCSKQESKEGKCYGGFPRLLTFVRDIKKREKNVIVLSSGEFFLGRSLHALHGWKLAHALLPGLELDAMSLSNHDFDSGVFELSAFLYAMKFPVLCANMWARNTSFLYSRVNKSVVLDVGGRKVGIVGYIHRHALKKTRNAVSVKFLPEIPALQEEVKHLESEGIDNIIALGHAGYYTDLEIARKVKGVDIVIGGDSDIMLFDPGPDANLSSKIGNIHGNYPRVHQHEPEVENDKSLTNRTLVLHIPQHGMFVGVLRATFDDKGKIIHESGEPVLLDSSIPQDEDTLEFLQYAKGALEKLSEHSRLPDDSELLGTTKKILDGNPRNCRMRECSLGNFIADAVLHEFTFHCRNKSQHRYSAEQWGPIDAVVFNSGPIKRSIEPGFITIQDILKSVGLGGFIKRVYMSGQHLFDMMENSVKHYDPRGVTPPGAFLQVAGLKVQYDISKIPGNRVRNLEIRCRDCGDDNYYLPVKLYKTYIVGMPSFVRDGRDGFYDFEEMDDEDMGQFDAQLIVEHLRRVYEIEPKLDGRIKFYQPENDDVNLNLDVPPLLFGEPLSEINHSLYMNTNPKLENVTDTLSEDPSNSSGRNDELVDKSKTNDDENNHVLKNYRTEEKHSVSPLYELDDSTGTHQELKFDKISEDLTAKITSSNTEEDIELITGNKRNLLNQSGTEKSLDFLSRIEEIDNNSNITVSQNYSQTENITNIVEIFKVLLNSSSEKFVTTLEKLSEVIPGLHENFLSADRVSNLKNRLLKKRSVLESLEGDINKPNDIELEDYVSFMETFLRDLFRDVIINSTGIESTPAYSGNTVPDGKLIKMGVTASPWRDDFRASVIQIMKSILTEDTVKKLSSELIDFLVKANNSISYENHP